ncbi:hypothetical protein BMS3Bbin14_00451 [bacterium BMS3Bbin14]|nr:hypothetical protein BMS3Abin13_00477 [bacterium BMS3Abin13]GBE51993.1 hypothetical protein BMS3Bbin14_00451 [bacterium BMS3Bbin14]
MKNNRLLIPGLLLLTVLISTPVFATETGPQGPNERQEIIQLGRMATKKLVRTLGSRMKKHLRENGPAGALGFCAAKAQELTARINRELPAAVRVKRISLRYRNPLDAPLKDEAGILRALHLLKNAGAVLPDYVLQRVGRRSYKFYRPITINKGVCLNCHGHRARMKPGVKKALAKFYPDDRATGYNLGDLRGAVVVTIKRR